MGDGREGDAGLFGLNIRMATTLPHIQLAVVGIDKIIPEMADMPKFLALLARSAAGQTISSYLSIVTGPRRAGTGLLRGILAEKQEFG